MATAPANSFRRCLSRIGHALAWSVVAGLVLLAAGKGLSDGYHWSQYLSWIPTLPACLVATIALLASWLLVVPRRRGRWVRRTGWAMVIAGVFFATGVEWAGGEAPPGPPREQRLRVAFWNFSNSGEPGWESPALSLDPDLVVVRAGTCTNPEGVKRRMGDHASFCWEEGFMVTSRLPIKSWGSGKLNVRQGLGLDPRASDLVRKGRDPGRAMWLLLDAHSRLGRDVVVWFVDMPSDLSLWRVVAMRDASVALEAGPRVRYINDELGRWVEAPDSALSRDVFKNPDLIIGDFNTPHGSRSLDLIRRGFASAYDQAGVGYAATFPREWPLWQLDQAFLAPSLRACAHDVIDTGSGTHRLMVVDVENTHGPAR